MADPGEEARLRAVVDTAVDGVILIGAGGQILMFNPACERLFGYRADEVIGRNVKMLMPAPYREQHDGYVENYKRTGNKKIIGIGREVAGQRKDGSIFPMGLSVGEAKQNGESVYVGIIHDLTERKQAEQQIREGAARLRALFDTAVDGMILIDAEGLIQMFNPACEQLFGYRAEEVIGENVRMLMPSPYREEHDQYIQNFHRTGEHKIIGSSREVIGRRKDGSTFPMDLSVGEAKQVGGPIFVGIIHDLTDAKRRDALLVQAQRMEAVGKLSGGIAHDFNNLLTVVVGNAEFLGEELRAQPGLQRLADEIVRAGERGAELTQRLLAFGRRQALQPSEIDCNQLVEGMQTVLRRMLAEDIVIRSVLEPQPVTVYADPAQLEKALFNLAINARDAMPGGGTLTFTTAAVPLDRRYGDLHPEVEPGNYVMIAVTDTGHGMPREVLARVFEPFFTTKEIGKGSGLGLSMVYGYVKQSNGHVAVYSEPGLGTTVRLYLPVAPTAGTAGLPEPVLEMATGREAVLVAEDDPFVRSYAVATLQALGYAVIEAVDGKDALRRLNEGVAVDVLLTDIMMPGGINGWELAERARQLRPHLKVLLTSGYALETLAEHGRLPPPGAVIVSKPYRRAELARRLREAIASST